MQRDQQWAVVFLGTHDEIRAAVYADAVVPGTTSVGPVRRINSKPRTFGGGTFAYAIRKRGARALVRRANTGGILQASDWFMLEAIGVDTGVISPGLNITAYRCDPPLITSSHALQRSSSNTDETTQVESDVHDLYPAGRLLLGAADRNSDFAVP